MRVLLTGGAGFIGQTVARQLVEDGHRVRICDLRPNTVSGVEAAICSSVLDPYALEESMRGCDAVMHLAASVGVGRTESRRLECLHLNIQGTVCVLDAAVKAGVQKVLLASSSEVYGDFSHGKTSEDSPLNPKSIYAVSKLASEEYLLAYHKEFGVEAVTVRFFNVYGIGQRAEFVVTKFIESVRNRQAPTVHGDGSQTRSFCYVDDAARGAILALNSATSQPDTFNIGNDEVNISVAALAERVVEICGRPLLRPVFVDLPLTDRSAAREIYRRSPDITKARKALGFTPTVGIDEGIRRIWQASKVS